jgi:hypothetical protein
MRHVVALFSLFVLALTPGIARAHQPHFTISHRTEIANPAVSQAWYAELKGTPDTYLLRIPDSLLLYVNILMPDIPGITKDAVADIFAVGATGDSLKATLGGPNSNWPTFFEPVGGDSYFQGPEFREPAGPGTYKVIVSRPGNHGKYVLAVGEKESFPPAEMVRVIGLMPRLKHDFFGKPAWTAYFNGTGIFMGVTAVIVAGVVVLVLALAHR